MSTHELERPFPLANQYINAELLYNNLRTLNIDDFIFHDKYDLREDYEIDEDIRFGEQFTYVYVSLETYHKTDQLVDFFTEDSIIHVKKDAESKSLYDLWYHGDLYKRVSEILRRKNLEETPENLREAIYEVKGTYNASPESTIVFIAIIKLLFQDKHPKILDGAAGYGSRLLAAIVTGSEYFGIEPNEMSQTGFKSMIEMFGQKEYQKVVLDGLPNCQELNNIEDGHFDLVFFSPPLWGGEVYSEDEKQSINMFRDEEMWNFEFLIASLRVLWNKLAEGGYIVFISMRYDKIREFMWRLFDSEYVDVISRKTYGGRFKPCWIWKKLGKGIDVRKIVLDKVSERLRLKFGDLSPNSVRVVAEMIHDTIFLGTSYDLDLEKLIE